MAARSPKEQNAAKNSEIKARTSLSTANWFDGCRDRRDWNPRNARYWPLSQIIDTNR